ncbi:MAG TPA: butyrate kinase [Bacteroidales bacterium]|nr:MAG: Butyrate kinase 2 [Bacteroidetes bacterium ADurb.Bin041]HNV49903.1 butyrate kinase [Bacteroidales bacterium]HPW43230.1 butyrate kinase [Bacteroidales bacterium]
MVTPQILVIYPQVNDTKIGIFKNSSWIFFKTIKFRRPDDENVFKSVLEQESRRKEQIINELRDNDINIYDISVIMARGGLVKPIKSGIYEINEALKEDLRKSCYMHETNLGGLIADHIASLILNSKAYMADPVSVDELDDLARVSGHPMFQRKSLFHALNHKFAGRSYAKSINRNYEDLNLVIAHVGEGGISIGAHKKGRVIDVNQAYDGDGPFALTRSGEIAYGDLIEICFSGKYEKNQLRQILVENGGLKAHLGTTNINLVEELIKNGNLKADIVLRAMAYQVAKHIGAMFVVIDQDVDAILLSGNIFQSKCFTDEVKKRILKLGHVVISPFVSDMDALADNAMMILKEEVQVLHYE